MKTQISEL